MILSSILAFLAPMVGLTPAEEKPEPAPYDGPAHSLNDFIAWLETKPASGRYEWRSGRNCLFAQYGKERKLATSGRSPYIAALEHIGCRNGQYEPYDLANPLPWTYGAALERARYARKHNPE